MKNVFDGFHLEKKNLFFFFLCEMFQTNTSENTLILSDTLISNPYYFYSTRMPSPPSFSIYLPGYLF